MNNKYQKNMPKTSTEPGLAVPDAVTIAMGEIAEDMREGLAVDARHSPVQQVPVDVVAWVAARGPQ